MNQLYPVPPPELLEQWSTEANRQDCVSYTKSIAIDAAQWGADMELEACCALMDDWGLDETDLRAARRPKPPSLKKQALHELNDVYNRDKIEDSTYDTIRKALEALPE